jgi:hypothetical protein
METGRNFSMSGINLGHHDLLLIHTSRFGRLVADWSDETMNPDMIPYGMLLDLSNV